MRNQLCYSLATMKTLFKISYKTVYKCHECGATSYQPVIERAPGGALLANGQYRCSGCHSVFTSVKAWWAPRESANFQANRSFG